MEISSKPHLVIHLFILLHFLNGSKVWFQSFSIASTEHIYNRMRWEDAYICWTGRGVGRNDHGLFHGTFLAFQLTKSRVSCLPCIGNQWKQTVFFKLKSKWMHTNGEWCKATTIHTLCLTSLHLDFWTLSIVQYSKTSTLKCFRGWMFPSSIVIYLKSWILLKELILMTEPHLRTEAD